MSFSAMSPIADSFKVFVGPLDYMMMSDYKADQIPRVMVMSDAQPRKTHVLDRGEYLKPTTPVEFGTPEFLPPMAAELRRAPSSATSSCPCRLRWPPTTPRC